MGSSLGNWDYYDFVKVNLSDKIIFKIITSLDFDEKLMMKECWTKSLNQAGLG